MNNRKIKQINSTAFTLAEVLLTLLIIGVVASLVIPNLINDTQDAEYKIAWKKAYGNIVQIFMLSKQEDPTIFDGYNCADGSGRNIYNALKNTMGFAKECNGNTFGNCWSNTGVNPDSVLDPGCPYFMQSRQNNSSAFVARDGTFWLLYSWNNSTGCPIMAVDINGNKGPNQWNKDVFDFRVAYGVIKLSECAVTPNATNYLK